MGEIKRRRVYIKRFVIKRFVFGNVVCVCGVFCELLRGVHADCGEECIASWLRGLKECFVTRRGLASC